MISFSPHRELPPGCSFISSRTKSLNPRLLKSPRRAQPAIPPPTMTTAAFFRLVGAAEKRPVAQSMADLEGVVDESAGDRAIALEREAHQRRAAGLQELAARELQWLMSFQS